MRTLVSDSFLLRQSVFSLSSRLASNKNRIFINSVRQRCTWKPKPVALSCSTFASPDPDFSIYGGWEELELTDEEENSGMLEPFRTFVISLGIDDRKHALPFLLGFFAALTVSRVRFFTIALIPVSVLVFLGGFAIGVAQAGFVVKKMGRNGGGLGVFQEKLKQLEALFDDVDGKMSYLRKGFEGGTLSNDLGMGDSENYLQIVEYVRVAIGEAQKTLTDSFSNDFFNGHFDFDFGEKKMNQKSSRKTMEFRASGMDFFQFFTGMLQESLIGSTSKKPKDSINEKLGQQFNPMDAKCPSFLVPEREMVAGNEIGESSRSQVRSVNQGSSNVEEYDMPSNEKRGRIPRKTPEKVNSENYGWDNGDAISNEVSMLNGDKYNFKIGSLGSDMFSFDEEGDNQNSNSSRLRFMTNHDSFQKIVFEKNYERGAFNSHLHDSADGNIFQKKTKNMEYLTRESKSFFHEHTLETQNRAHQPSRRSESSELKEKQMNEFDFEESSDTLRSHPSLGNQRPTTAKAEGKMPYSSHISTDERFADSIKEASYLLKQAREYMMTQAAEERADASLYKAADLLSAAIVMRPMSLVAVGQLGNTYLLHGELKLKVTRELRTLLLRSGSLFNGKPGGLRLKRNDNIVTSKVDITSILVSVCEECEGLLVKAGRKYRRALSIDGGDVRALYNWGLALCFRAQLIADVGPEAAMDADKVYLAAIDKFNAMMSGSNAFTPDALYRWGMILQQRSHLRPNNSREKSKLLHQAKSLFEEVLSMDSDNQLARHALVSCVSELNNNHLRASGR